MHSINILPPELEKTEQFLFSSPAQTCIIQPKECPIDHRVGMSTSIDSTSDAVHTNKAFPPPQCPAGLKIYKTAQQEFDRIKKAHPTLAPTGCTAEFCQSGRATRLNEPRVGRDRPLSEIEQECSDFLEECRRQGVIETDDQLHNRVKTALQQIKETSIETTVTDCNGNQYWGLAAGVWDQSVEELTYGIRASWRNSRRCIMRSKYDQLALCDLRNVTSSREMADRVVRGMQQAFNKGRIIPTTFMFPPRHPTKRGPMLWNSNILAFAGYRMADGSVLGDPMNIDLTDAIMELGWKPPTVKTQWDVLPIVTMADGETPFIMELPADLKRTVRITHPRYRKEFQDLGLEWTLAPALSRLGFDIGGNQYTASPFIGWFMDAEIGVRNLADTFRYNVLPQIVGRLHLSDDPDTPFEDLPEFLRLAALSRAQAELNLAVYYSYLHEGVTIVDTLTSSADYQKFDQERHDEVGYRLPADPYWLSPPQGSIVPLWHQGAAPNYQPKPMICRHVQDPIKAWRRENPRYGRRSGVRTTASRADRAVTKPRVKIFACSAGVNAGKMADKLYKRLLRLSGGLQYKFEVESTKALNSLDLTTTNPQDTIFVIASTTGRGEMPRNASAFIKRYADTKDVLSSSSFSVFGNGDSTYGDTYNAAGKAIHEAFLSTGCQPLFEDIYNADTAYVNPDWSSFNRWLEAIVQNISGAPEKIVRPLQRMNTARVGEISAVMPTAELVSLKRFHNDGLLQVVLNIGDTYYSEMDHIKILTPNQSKNVRLAITKLRLKPDDSLDWHHEKAYNYLSRYVDLEHSLKTLNWYPGFDDLDRERQERLRSLTAIDVLADLSQPLSPSMSEAVCKALPSLRPRLFSVASSPMHNTQHHSISAAPGNLVDIIVKVNPGGRFSDTFLSQASIGSKLRFGITRSDSWEQIQLQKSGAPFIAITTGSGIGPVRAVLQRRVQEASQKEKQGQGNDLDQDAIALHSSPFSSSSLNSSTNSFADSPVSPYSSTCTSITDFGEGTAHLEPEPGSTSTSGPISLFAGFKAEDTALIEEIVEPATRAGLFDMLELVPSNKTKIRVQDHLMLPRNKDKLSKLLRHPSCIVFVCANEAASNAIEANLSVIIGADIREVLQERYLEEAFRC